MIGSSSPPATEPRPAIGQLGNAVWPAFALLVLAGVGLRAWIVAGPLGEVEADESVIGLMALHALQGEYPAFYWGQPYLGSMEAYLVAAAFAVFGPSNLLLKLVPGLVYLGFLILAFLTARRSFGDRPALLTAAYLALPPSFLAFWSVKARGGYVELLALGQALLFIAPWVATGRPRLAVKLGLAGFLTGLLLWTHVLGLVYAAPIGCYLLLRLHRALLGPASLATLVGLLLGIAPFLAYNLEHDWETFHALAGSGMTPAVVRANLARLAQVGVPIILGFGQATSSPLLFASDWPHRPGSLPWLPPLLLSLLAVALLPAARHVRIELRQEVAGRGTALMTLGVLILTPLVAGLGRFGELVGEPRYALPLYAAVPLFALALAGLVGRHRVAGVAAVLMILVVNVQSLVTADPRLNLPTTASGSTAANRWELLAHLESRGIAAIYTDYWLAYPLMFESDERVLAAVSSGGYDRFAPYPHLVAMSDSPAFVFIRGSVEQAEFDSKLTAFAGSAQRASVSIYDVYSDARPLDRLRP